MQLAMTIMPFFMVAVTSYLIGSISFSIIFTKLFRNEDVRDHGSGNAGATNVLRTAGKLPALLTLIFDFSKMVAAILLALYIFSVYPVNFIGGNVSIIKFMAGFFCVLGHIYPLYFGFHGGKGVLSSAALVLLIDWRMFCIGIGVFILVLIITRIVSLSSIIAMLSFPISTFFIQYFEHNTFAVENALFALVFAAIIIYKHSGNIKRLLNGTESKLGQKQNKTDAG